MDVQELKVIARVENGYGSKFGIPRQSGMAQGIESKIVFEPQYRDPNSVRGLEGFSHIWIIWGFSRSPAGEWSPTVRPPRLGGNTRVGVFATRSPFRPNPIGLSSVRLERIEFTRGEGPVLYVLGADILNGTPVYDIKPYLPFTDCHADASAGFAEACSDYRLAVVFSKEADGVIPAGLKEQLTETLASDPRPSYHHDENRIYGTEFSGYEVKFFVKDDVLTVVSAEKTNDR